MMKKSSILIIKIIPTPKPNVNVELMVHVWQLKMKSPPPIIKALNGVRMVGLKDREHYIQHKNVLGMNYKRDR